ncbi:MAG: response regulator [Bacteroidetes bacterium]|nr:response regulator [Bacteroidota bacterium]
MMEWADYQFADKTILVVEDIDTSIKFFDAALRKSQAKILWSKTGEEAIEILENHIADIDLVLLDLNLPGVNGFDVLKYLRDIDPELPVIVQTAYLFSGERKTSLSMGANGFISKPVQLVELLNNIAKFLNPELNN